MAGSMIYFRWSNLGRAKLSNVLSRDGKWSRLYLRTVMLNQHKQLLPSTLKVIKIK